MGPKESKHISSLSWRHQRTLGYPKFNSPGTIYFPNNIGFFDLFYAIPSHGFWISFPVSVVTVDLPHFQTHLEIILLMIYPSNPYPYELFHYIPVIFPYLLVKSLHGNSAKSKAVLVCHKPTKLASSIISNRRKNPKGRKIRSKICFLECWFFLRRHFLFDGINTPKASTCFIVLLKSCQYSKSLQYIIFEYLKPK